MRRLFESELGIVRHMRGLDPGAAASGVDPPGVFDEGYLDGDLSHGFNRHFSLTLHDLMNEELPGPSGCVVAPVLPGTLGCELFLNYEVQTGRPLLLEQLGASLHRSEFATHIARASSALQSRMPDAVPLLAGSLRRFIVMEPHVFILAGRVAVPMAGDWSVAESDVDVRLAVRSEQGKVIALDGWLRMPAAAMAGSRTEWRFACDEERAEWGGGGAG